jgi:hypothetical protein
MKKYINLAISGVSLLPTSIALENSDNLEVVSSFSKAIGEWFGVLMASLIIAGMIWGVLRLFKMKVSFISVVTYSFYGMALLILLIVFVLPLR